MKGWSFQLPARRRHTGLAVPGRACQCRSHNRHGWGGGSEVAEMTGRCFSRSLVFAGCPTNVWLQEREKKLEHRVRKHNPSGDFAVTEVKRFLGHGPWQNMVRGEKWLTMCPCFQVLFLLLVLSCFFLQGVIWGKLYRSRG